MKFRNILDRKQAASVLFDIANNPGKNMTAISRMGKGETTRMKRIHEFIDAGLVRVENYRGNGCRLYPTESGRVIHEALKRAERLQKIGEEK